MPVYVFISPNMSVFFTFMPTVYLLLTQDFIVGFLHCQAWYYHQQVTLAIQSLFRLKEVFNYMLLTKSRIGLLFMKKMYGEDGERI